MREVFVDTGFWVAIVNRRDDLHVRAKLLASTHTDSRLVTTEGVLMELLNYFGDMGPTLREAASEMDKTIRDNVNVTVMPHSADTQKEARELYAARLDKGYSVVDCYSMIVMSKRGISAALSHDKHFQQEQFIALMREG